MKKLLAIIALLCCIILTGCEKEAESSKTEESSEGSNSSTIMISDSEGQNASSDQTDNQTDVKKEPLGPEAAEEKEKPVTTANRDEKSSESVKALSNMETTIQKTEIRTQSAVPTEIRNNASVTTVYEATPAPVRTDKKQTQSEKIHIQSAPMTPTATSMTKTKPISDKDKKPAPAVTTSVTTKKPASSTNSAVPKLDITAIIDAAVAYGQNIGLTLDSTANACWDNPTYVDSSSKYTERDLNDRLDWYLISGFTSFWVWYEPTGNNAYNIYIGYA